ncbi:MAG: GNAT family N-acetyltransferase [Pseudohongiellaceae bacterium]
MDIDQLELAARKAWPALEELESKHGVLRYAAGASRRANSLSPSVVGMREPARLMQMSESWFYPRGLPSILRVIAAVGGWQPSGCEPRACEPYASRLDRCLASAGYQQAATTLVMTRSIACQAPVRSVSGDALPLADWLQAWYRIRSQSPDDFNTHLQMLSLITDPHCFLVARDASGIARATALGVLSDGLLGIYGVATQSESRRQGLAAALLIQLINWAASHGSRSAYLQVELANQPAIALYCKLGFQESYRYWYRCKNQQDRVELVAGKARTNHADAACLGAQHPPGQPSGDSPRKRKGNQKTGSNYHVEQRRAGL